MLSLQLEKIHALGFKPVLLLCKETKKKGNACETLTPRYKLTAYAQDYLHLHLTSVKVRCMHCHNSQLQKVLQKLHQAYYLKISDGKSTTQAC